MKGKGITFSRNRNRVEPEPDVENAVPINSAITLPARDTRPLERPLHPNEIITIERRIQELKGNKQRIDKRFQLESKRFYRYFDDFQINLSELQENNYRNLISGLSYDDEIKKEMISNFEKLGQLRRNYNNTISSIDNEISNLERVLSRLRETAERTGGGLKRNNAWIDYVLKIKTKYNISYYEALIKAKSTYKG